jgi:hypothetical protein
MHGTLSVWDHKDNFIVRLEDGQSFGEMAALGVEQNRLATVQVAFQTIAF